MSILQILSKNIKERRKALGLSQTAFAELLGGKDQGNISKIEKGIVPIGLSMLEEIAIVLKVQPHQLLMEDGSDINTQLNDAFEDLSKEDKKLVLDIVEAIKKKN